MGNFGLKIRRIPVKPASIHPKQSLLGHPWPQSKRTHFNPHEEPTLA